MVFDLVEHKGTKGKKFDVNASKIIDPWLIGLIESFNYLPPSRVDDSLYMQGYKYGKAIAEPIEGEGDLIEDSEELLVKAEMEIPSSSGSGSYSVVLMNDKFNTCSCPHFMYRLNGTKKACKHIIKALKIQEGEDEASS